MVFENSRVGFRPGILAVFIFLGRVVFSGRFGCPLYPRGKFRRKRTEK